MFCLVVPGSFWGRPDPRPHRARKGQGRHRDLPLRQDGGRPVAEGLRGERTARPAVLRTWAWIMAGRDWISARVRTTGSRSGRRAGWTPVRGGGQFSAEDFAVKEEESIAGDVLGAGGDVLLGGGVGKVLADGLERKVVGVPATVEPEEAPEGAEVGVVGAKAEVLEPDDLSDLVRKVVEGGVDGVALVDDAVCGILGVAGRLRRGRWGCAVKSRPVCRNYTAFPPFLSTMWDARLQCGWRRAVKPASRHREIRHYAAVGRHTNKS